MRYRTTTDQFVLAFTKPSDYAGPVAALIGDGLVPSCVDKSDDRVKAIIERCKRETTKERQTP